MATHTVPNSNENRGYPMYFQILPIDGGLFLIDMAHFEQIRGGDTFKLHRQDLGYTILEITEERKPGKTGKNNHADDVIFYQGKASINKPQK